MKSSLKTAVNLKIDGRKYPFLVRLVSWPEIRRSYAEHKTDSKVLPKTKEERFSFPLRKNFWESKSGE